MRKATAKMMEDNYHKFDRHTDEASFPEWMVDHFRQLKINGL